MSALGTLTGSGSLIPSPSQRERSSSAQPTSNDARTTRQPRALADSFTPSSSQAAEDRGLAPTGVAPDGPPITGLARAPDAAPADGLDDRRNIAAAPDLSPEPAPAPPRRSDQPRDASGSASSVPDEAAEATQATRSTNSEQDPQGAPKTQDTEEAQAPEDAGARRKANGEPLTPAEEKQVEELVKRDREVRAHENAHKAAAGQYATGGPTYSYQQGPDGKRYAVGGSVSIDASPIPDDPQATIRKMQIVRRAALAPAEPSSTDRRVAADAASKMMAAQRQLAQERAQTSAGEDADPGAAAAPDQPERGAPGAQPNGDGDAPSTDATAVRRRLEQRYAPAMAYAPQLDLAA